MRHFRTSRLGKIVEWLFIVSLAYLLSAWIQQEWGGMVHVKGDSMVPTFHHHDILWVDRRDSALSNLHHGDIVIVDTGNIRLIKRVMGLSGDTLTWKDGVLYRNDKRLDESYINEPMNDSNLSIQVPEGMVFVLGDNRNHSGDSREFGPFLPEQIKGVVRFELWNSFGRAFIHEEPSSSQK